MNEHGNSPVRKEEIPQGNDPIRILQILPDVFQSDMPFRPAVTEIYLKQFPALGHCVVFFLRSLVEGTRVEKQAYQGVDVYLLPRLDSSPRSIFRWFHSYRTEYAALKKIIEDEKITILQVRNNIYDVILALLLRRKYGIPVVFQYSFPLYALAGNHRYYRVIIENRLLLAVMHRVDLIFPISSSMREVLVQNGIAADKVFPVPMGINPDWAASDEKREEIRARYSLGGSRVLLYLGTMDRQRELEFLIQTFAIVRGKASAVKLFMVGDGNGRTDLEAQAKRLGVADDVIFAGQVPYFEVPSYVAAADICVSPIPPREYFIVSSPTKLLEYLALAKPVVANEEIPEQFTILSQSNGGILVRYDPASFAEGILQLLGDAREARARGQQGYTWVRIHRSYENIAREIETQYYTLLARIHGA